MKCSPFEFALEPSWPDPSKHDSGLLSVLHVRRLPSQAGALSAEVAVPDEGALHDQRTGDEKLVDKTARVAEGEMGSLKLGNVWVVVQLIHKTTRTNSQLFKNANIAYLRLSISSEYY